MTKRSPYALRPVLGAALLVLAGGLAGCDNPRESLGLAHKAPDEFAVVSRAPLEVPPQFRLRPPEPGATRPQEGEVRDQARTTVLGNATVTADLSPGQRVLLERAGAEQAPSNIRAVIDRETRGLVRESQRLVDKVLFWREDAPYGTVLDPAKEAERLRRNQEEGLPPTEGETPIIERRGGIL